MAARRTKSVRAARTPQRAQVLAEIQRAGVRGVSCLQIARTLDIPVRHAMHRACELICDGLVVRGPRFKVGLDDACHYVTPDLLEMHVAWWQAWKAEAKRQRIAALPKKQPKAVKPPKPAKPPKPVKPAKPEPNPLDRLWSKGRFAHVRRAAGTVPPPETRGVRSIFEVAA